MSKSPGSSVKVLSQAPNSWVLHAPGRKYPGVLVQGDSLKTLFDLASEIERLATPNSDVSDASTELRLILEEHLLSYQEVLEAHRIELPYPRPVQPR